jgi:hypothetical protein
MTSIVPGGLGLLRRGPGILALFKRSNTVVTYYRLETASCGDPAGGLRQRKSLKPQRPGLGV